jgi:hypothetical protein
MLRTALRYNTVKHIEVLKEIKDVYGDPFHDIDVFGQHDDRLEVPLDECCLDERATKI